MQLQTSNFGMKCCHNFSFRLYAWSRGICTCKIIHIILQMKEMRKDYEKITWHLKLRSSKQNWSCLTRETRSFVKWEGLFGYPCRWSYRFISRTCMLISLKCAFERFQKLWNLTIEMINHNILTLSTSDKSKLSQFVCYCSISIFVPLIFSSFLSWDKVFDSFYVEGCTNRHIVSREIWRKNKELSDFVTKIAVETNTNLIIITTKFGLQSKIRTQRSQMLS